MTVQQPTPVPVWRDATADTATRVADLTARMTTAEKIAQLYGVWVGMDGPGGNVAPHQHDFSDPALDWDELIKDGIGQLTRPFGTSPVDPALGALTLAKTQREIMAAGRHGIPALVHEECLTGLAAWQATVFPAPLSWGASFDPELVERMAASIGRTMRGLGVHQGLAPVLDVVRDLRWGRVEETIGEDPHLVGLVGSAYVRGLQSAGVIATLKHFAGYSASRAGRNLAPVSIGRRELSDVILPPFEMALRAGAGSVMNAYTDLDGIPTASDGWLLTEVLRDTYGFTGTVVADYYAVAFLQLLHGVAGSPAEAALLALGAGIDVELPTVNCFGKPLLTAVEDGMVGEQLIDRALGRVLRQKCELGLLDDDWSPDPAGGDGEPASLDGGPEALDSAESRGIARELAEKSVVLLANGGVLPLAPGSTVALVGPRANDRTAMLGCYSFPMHVGVHHPDVAIGIEIPTVLEALGAEDGGYDVRYARGCSVTGVGDSDDELAEAVALAAAADVCVAILGDLAGLFGRGTSGEGCDAPDLHLPGRQEELLQALVATGTPVVLVLMVGRPYDISRVAGKLAAAVCAFFPGEEGGPAVAGVLSGRVNPSGRLPVSFPAGANQPSTYLGPALAHRTEVSNIDPTPQFGFGHGLTYAPVTWVDVARRGPEGWSTDAVCEIDVALRNDADRDTTEVVQVYLHDPVAEVVRPVQQLLAAARVELPAGGSRVVTLGLHADLTSFTGRSGERIVDTGRVELRVGASSADIRAVIGCEMTGTRRPVGFDRVMRATVSVTSPATAGS